MNTIKSLNYRVYKWFSQQIFSRKKRLLFKTSFFRLLKRSDVQRWVNPESLYADWEDRTKMMAQWIPNEGAVMEFGCGSMTLKKYLPQGVCYTPSDIVLRNQETVVIDFNQRSPLVLPFHDVFFFSGVLEYAHDLKRLIKASSQACSRLIASYVPCESKDAATLAQRCSEGWVNDYSKTEFLKLMQENGFKLVDEKSWRNQLLFCFQRICP